MPSVTCSIEQKCNPTQCSALGCRQHGAKQIAQCQTRKAQHSVSFMDDVLAKKRSKIYKLPSERRGTSKSEGCNFF